MAVYRVVVRGDRIQAVGFREGVAAALKKMGLYGRARNVRDRQEVLLEVVSDEKFGKNDLQNVMDGVRKENPLVKGEVADFKERDDPDIEKEVRDSHTFQVIREDDLHEMMWALQGAGYLFNHATKMVTALLDIKKAEQDMRLKSLKIELTQTQNLLSETDKTPPGELICLKDFISNPTKELPEQTLEELITFYYEYDEFINSPKNEITKRKEVMIDRISSMLKSLKPDESLNSGRENN